MAAIHPIRALRFTEKAGNIKDLVCPPYDIVSEAEKNAILGKNPENLIKLELPLGENRYENAAKELKKMEEDGIIARDEKAGIFIYRETFSSKITGEKDMTLTGMICRCSLYDFSEKIVLPHEETLTKAKADRFELMKATSCNFSSIYSLYNDASGRIKEIQQRETEKAPIYCFEDGENVIHSLWKIEDEDTIKEIQDILADKQLFIADGHHRYETACNFKKYCEENKIDLEADKVLMTIVDMDDEGLLVLPTHRLIVDLDVNEKELIEKCLENFEVSEAPVELVEETLGKIGNHAFALYTGGGFVSVLKLRAEAEGRIIDGRSEAYSDLDVSILHSLVLERALGIDKQNMANQVNLRYTRSKDEAIAAVNSGNASACFIINATKVSQIKAVALAGDKMPQKSTYFYPKLKTGLVMNTLERG